MPEILERYSAFLIDLDGVVYLLNKPIPGSRDVIEHLQTNNIPFTFLTNNSVATPGQYVERLERLGMSISEDNIVTSPQAVGRYLELNHETEGRTGFVIGESGLIDEVTSRGIEIMDGESAYSADFVFVGWDRTFDFEKLKTAVIAIRNGAEYIVTNTDSTFPTPTGLWPGAGSIVAAVTTGGGREPMVAGKPNPAMVEIAIERMGSAAEDTLLVGDRLDTDILAGLNAEVDTMLVLTGVSNAEEVDAADIRPTIIVDSLSELINE